LRCDPLEPIWEPPESLLEDLLTDVLNFLGMPIVKAFRRHHGDAGMAVVFVIPVEEKRIPWLTEEQQTKLMPHLPEYDHRIYKFLFRTGVKVNEATGLQKADILWEEGYINVCHTINRDSELGPAKERNTRPIPLAEPVKETLKGKVEYLSPYVFLNKWGKHYSDDYLRDTYYKACDAARLPRITLKNASRSSWGMQKLRKGIPLSKVSEGYGHSDLKMTKRYARQIADDLKELYGETGTASTGTERGQQGK
jgi:integrase